MCQSCWGPPLFSSLFFTGPKSLFFIQKCIMQRKGSLGSCFQRTIILCVLNLTDGFWMFPQNGNIYRIIFSLRQASYVRVAFVPGSHPPAGLPGLGRALGRSRSPGVPRSPGGPAPRRSPWLWEAFAEVGSNFGQSQMAVAAGAASSSVSAATSALI